MIEYKGYVGRFEFDPEIDSFFGEVINTRDAITFYGRSIDELRAEMKSSIDTYLEVCEERGIDPEKPYRGEFLVRTDPELHRQLAIAAGAEDESLNAFVVKQLREVVVHHRDDARPHLVVHESIARSAPVRRAAKKGTSGAFVHRTEGGRVVERKRAAKKSANAAAKKRSPAGKSGSSDKRKR
ncbi:MAG TPA: type II toxin-antitoxin system HicB family antitoxin [Longimicrobiales bacterium]